MELARIYNEFRATLAEIVNPHIMKVSDRIFLDNVKVLYKDAIKLLNLDIKHTSTPEFIYARQVKKSILKLQYKYLCEVGFFRLNGKGGKYGI